MIGTISRRAKSFFEPFLDVCAPRICAVCESRPVERRETPRRDRDDDASGPVSDYVCAVCLDRLPLAPSPEHIHNELVSRFPGDALALASARSCFAARAHDEHGVMSLVHHLKYRGIPHVGVDLGRILAGHFAQDPTIMGAHLLIPVPVHPARRRERGYNQAERIAAGASEILGIAVHDHSVRRTRNRRSQTSLRGAQRMRNVEESFAPGLASELIRDRTVILIDDVLTTGSTLNALAHCVLECGARNVHAMTVIRAR
jgi:ComF family protein